jgi:DNA-binding response OmpR family regulator
MHITGTGASRLARDGHGHDCAEENAMNAPRRILVIEDDAALREVLCEALNSAGYHAIPSDHAVSPLDVQQLRPVLVVLDLMLDGEPEGFGWLEDIRAWHWTKQLPVVVCSSYLAPDAPAAQWAQAMAAATVSKPFAIEEFLATVARCLDPATAPSPERVA